MALSKDAQAKFDADCAKMRGSSEAKLKAQVHLYKVCRKYMAEYGRTVAGWKQPDTSFCLLLALESAKDFTFEEKWYIAYHCTNSSQLGQDLEAGAGLSSAEKPSVMEDYTKLFKL